MTTENNVAAQAGDFDPAPKYEYSLDGKTVKWTNRDRMPKVAAQAGDEPMRAALQTIDTHLQCAIEHLEAGRLERAKLCIETSRRTVQSVSPRATADVERVTITPALRRAVDMTRADLGESGSNYPAVRELLAFAESHIATTKPGA